MTAASSLRSTAPATEATRREDGKGGTDRLKPVDERLRTEEVLVWVLEAVANLHRARTNKTASWVQAAHRQFLAPICHGAQEPILDTVVGCEIELKRALLDFSVAIGRLRLYLSCQLAELRPGSHVWITTVAADAIHLRRRRVRSINVTMFPAGHLVLDDDGSVVKWTSSYESCSWHDMAMTAYQLLPSPDGTEREKRLLAVLHMDGPLPLIFHDPEQPTSTPHILSVAATSTAPIAFSPPESDIRSPAAI